MIDKNKPAYPYYVPKDQKNGWPAEVYEGVTIRQYYAAKAMQGILSAFDHKKVMDIDDWNDKMKARVKLAFEYADLMIAYENQEESNA